MTRCHQVTDQPLPGWKSGTREEAQAVSSLQEGSRVLQGPMLGPTLLHVPLNKAQWQSKFCLSKKDHSKLWRTGGDQALAIKEPREKLTVKQHKLMYVRKGCPAFPCATPEPNQHFCLGARPDGSVETQAPLSVNTEASSCVLGTFGTGTVSGTRETTP